MDTARQHFAMRGIKQTPLIKLTDEIGIAKSTFYAFFDSKEALYLELLHELSPEIEERVLRPALEEHLPPSHAIRRLLRAFIHELRTQPLLRRLLEHPDELRAIAERAGPEEFAAKGLALAPLRTFLQRHHAAARLRDDVDVDVIMGTMHAVTLLELQRKNLEPHHDRVMELMIDLVADGLAKERIP